MKNILTLLLLLFILSFSFGQTIILEETFDNNGWSLPAGWSRTSHPNSGGWNISSYSINGIPAFGNGTRIAIASDVGVNDSAHLDYLISPIVSLVSSSTNPIFMTFDYLQPGTDGSNGYVEISTDLGITWTVIDTLTETGANQSVESKAAIDLSAYVGEPNVRFRFHHTDNQQASNADYFAIDNVKIVEAFLRDAKVLTLDMERYIETGNRYFIGTFVNQGSAPIVSMNLNYSINDGPVVTNAATISSVFPGQVAQYFHFTAANFSIAGKNTIKFWVSDINGLNDQNPLNDTLVRETFVVSTPPAKNMFFAYLTGTWCGFCPDGVLTLNEIEEDHPDWNIHIATLHEGDAMSFPNGDTLLYEFTNSYPSGAIDLIKFSGEDNIGISRSIWESEMNSRTSAISPLSVSFVDAGWDSTTRLLSAIVRIDAFTDLDPNMRLNFWVMEDSVIGSGFGYDQRNFYNNDASHPYFGLGDPVVGYVHEHTLRHMVFGPWGAPGAVPLLKDGESHEMTISWPVPPQYDENQLEIMAMVFNYDGVNREGMESFNSAYMRLPLTPMTQNNTSIEDELQPKVLKAYPNPFSTRLSVEYEVPKTGYTEVKVVDLFGREIRTLISGTTAKGINTVYWDGNNSSGNKVPAGIYMIGIETAGVVTYQRVVFEG